MDKLKQAVERAAEKLDREHEQFYEDLVNKSGYWEYDKYFVKLDDVERQEHIIYKKREDGRIQRTTITRRYYAKDDYQDSTETVIL